MHYLSESQQRELMVALCNFAVADRGYPKAGMFRWLDANFTDKKCRDLIRFWLECLVDQTEESSIAFRKSWSIFEEIVDDSKVMDDKKPLFIAEVSSWLRAHRKVVYRLAPLRERVAESLAGISDLALRGPLLVCYLIVPLTLLLAVLGPQRRVASNYFESIDSFQTLILPLLAPALRIVVITIVLFFCLFMYMGIYDSLTRDHAHDEKEKFALGCSLAFAVSLSLAVFAIAFSFHF